MKIIDILVTDQTEDSSLREIAKDYDYAIVYRNGHKFIDRNTFVSEISSKKFFIAGHVLDREPLKAYYELHIQCYVIHLPTYLNLNCPEIGQQEFHSPHIQISPNRSDENYHDDYTPWWVEPGTRERQYEHKAHGWNILRIAFDKKLPVLVFNSVMRNAKKFNYETNS